jgi:RNA polymerase sigma factor (sigma-70 family)
MTARGADPLVNVAPLIRDVYAYVAYRVSNESDAEEITSRVFERAVRYRDSYDGSKGTPTQWLIGIARTQISENRLRHPSEAGLDAIEASDGFDLEATSLERLALRDAVRLLDDRGRELIALRYGIGLSPGEIAADLGLEESAVNVALHRTRARLRSILTDGAGRHADKPISRWM